MPTDLSNQPLSSFEGASARTDQQKAALLASVAQAGTAGVQQYQQAQAQTNDLRGQAINSALGAAQTSPLGAIPGGASAVTAPIEQNFAMRQADLAQGQATFTQDIERQRAGNESFFGQMQQALPVVESRTKLAIQQILAEQEEARQQRDLQKQMAQMQLQEAQTRASSAGQDQRTPEEIEYAQLRNEGLRNENSSVREGNAIKQAATAKLESFRQSESPKVMSIIERAFDYDDPIKFLDSLVGTQLEMAGTADKGGRGKGHVPGALNYEYILDRVRQIQNAKPQGTNTNLLTTFGIG